MRVLLVSPWLHPSGGGLERYAWSVARELVAQGHEATLVGHAAQPFDESRDGVRVVAVKPALRLSNAPIQPALRRVVRALLRERPHDVVNAHTPVPGAAELAFLAARKEGVPFVVTYHAGRLESQRALLAVPARVHAATIERAMIGGAHGRVAVSRFVADSVYRGFASHVAPPGVDVERFAPGGAPVPGRVLFVGPASRAYSWKGLATLADAVDLVREHAPGAHLRVVGDGDLVDRYRARGVDVAGRVDDARLVEEYRSASVVVLPSLSAAESFGMVLAEANACARPVVGSVVGGIPCFVRDGVNGFLAPPGDAPALAERLRALLADASLARRMGEAGRALVEREHRWSLTAARHVEAFATPRSA